MKNDMNPAHTLMILSWTLDSRTCFGPRVRSGVPSPYKLELQCKHTVNPKHHTYTLLELVTTTPPVATAAINVTRS